MLATRQTVAEFVLDEHVVVFCPSGVVADKVGVRSKHSMGINLSQCSRPAKQEKVTSIKAEKSHKQRKQLEKVKNLIRILNTLAH